MARSRGVSGRYSGAIAVTGAGRRVASSLSNSDCTERRGREGNRGREVGGEEREGRGREGRGREEGRQGRKVGERMDQRDRHSDMK